MTDNERYMHGITTQVGRPTARAIAHLDYYGEPHEDDDPADYYEASMKGVRIA